VPVYPGGLLHPTVLAYAGLENKHHGYFGPEIRICCQLGFESMAAAVAAVESSNSVLDWEYELPQTEAAMSG